ncbi:hypothetical protein ABFX02_12G007900 [Erythranthe guttata]
MAKSQIGFSVLVILFIFCIGEVLAVTQKPIVIKIGRTANRNECNVKCKAHKGSHGVCLQSSVGLMEPNNKIKDFIKKYCLCGCLKRCPECK